MALPASGAISWAMIQAEFGGANPINMSEYYAGGGLVPAGTTGTNGAVPASGAISPWHFYGTSAVSLVIQILNGNADANDGFGGASVSYGTNGVCWYGGTSGSPQYNWCSSSNTTVTDDYQIMQTNTGSGVLSGPAASAWTSLASTVTWSLNGGAFGVAKQRNLTVSIRLGTGAVIDTGTVTLFADSEASCVVIDSWMGLYRAVDVKPFMVYSTYDPAEGFKDWPVEKVAPPTTANCVRITTESGAVLRCSRMTPFNLKAAKFDMEEGQWRYAYQMRGHEVVVETNGRRRWEKVVTVDNIGEQMVAPISFGGRSFAAGDDPTNLIYSHNKAKIIP